MLVQTAADIGNVVRDQRTRLGLTQAELASKIHVSRQWLVGLENGAPRVELQLVLRALNRLGLHVDLLPHVVTGSQRPEEEVTSFQHIDLDYLIDEILSTNDVSADLTGRPTAARTIPEGESEPSETDRDATPGRPDSEDADGENASGEDGGNRR